MSSSRLRHVLVWLVLSTFVASGASAQRGRARAPEVPAAPATGVEAARAAYLDADFERSRSLYRDVLEGAELDRESALEALRYLLALDALLGDTDAARGHARSAVALEPSVTAPEGSPDDAVALLEAARAEQAAAGASGSVDIAAAEPLTDGAPATIVFSYAAGPRSLIRALHLRCDGALGPHEATGSMPEVRLDTPETTGELRCDGEARTGAGAVLVRASEVLARAATTANPVAPASETDWPLILGVSGGVLAVVAAAVVVGVVLGTQSSGAPTFGPTQVCAPGWSTC